MKQRWDFFKETDSSFGVFYPKNYVVAAFETLERAQEIEARFRADGFDADEVTAAPGGFVVNEVESQKDANWLDRARAGIAAAIGTETGYIDDDLKLARRGGAFLFVHVPDDPTMVRVRALLARAHPIYARRYLTGAIERLVYPKHAAL